MSKTFDHVVAALPIKGRISRRSALGGAGAAAFGLAAGIAPAQAVVEAQAPVRPARAALVDLAARVTNLAGRCTQAMEHAAGLEDRALVIGSSKGRETAAARRLADRQQIQIDRLAQQLAVMQAITAEEVGYKARAVASLIGADPLSRSADLEHYSALVLSALRDAARLVA